MEPHPHQPPNNTEAERIVLGALLVDPGTLMAVKPILDASHFYLERHRWIYEAICALDSKRMPVEFVPLCDELERRGKLAQIGGAAYLTGLASDCMTTTSAEGYAQIIANAAGNRQIIETVGAIAAKAYSNGDHKETYAYATAQILAAAPRSTAEFISSEDSVMDLLIKIRLRLDEPQEIAGVTTGYVEWDRKFGGLLTGLHLIEGRTSSGKTWLALGIADGAAEAHKRVAVISLEMSHEDINYRRISRYSGILVNALRSGYIWEKDQITGKDRKREFNRDERERVEEASERVAALPVYFSAEHFTTSAAVIAKLSRMKAEYGIDLAVVDYVQKFRDKAERDEKAYGDAAHNLKDCADSLGIPIILLSQVNRESNKRDSRFLQVGDSRGSGQVDEAADTIYGLSSEDYGKLLDPTHVRKYELEVACLKDRLGGAAGRMIKLAIDPVTGAVENPKEQTKQNVTPLRRAA